MAVEPCPSSGKEGFKLWVLGKEAAFLIFF
jgi:hypothetical protein